MQAWNEPSMTIIQQALLLQKRESHDLPTWRYEKAWRPAAVLMPLVQIEYAWHLLFIRRPESAGDYHSGQVAFPGGKQDPSDETILHTALREADEEIGLRPADVQVLGQLGSHYVGSGFQITPIVASIPWPYDLRLNTVEVARVFTIPLLWLANDEHHEFRYWQPKSLDQPVSIPYFAEYDGELLWGATARMTLTLLAALRTIGFIQASYH